MDKRPWHLTLTNLCDKLFNTFMFHGYVKGCSLHKTFFSLKFLQKRTMCYSHWSYDDIRFSCLLYFRTVSIKLKKCKWALHNNSSMCSAETTAHSILHLIIALYRPVKLAYNSHDSPSIITAEKETSAYATKTNQRRRGLLNTYLLKVLAKVQLYWKYHVDDKWPILIFWSDLVSKTENSC